MIPEVEAIQQVVQAAQKIVVLQADNPDGDSLASSLALEHILSDMGKDVYLYCGVDMPEYLRFMPGWDRVLKTLPSSFDLSIVVDTSAHILLQKLESSPERPWIASKPCIVLDHHTDVPCDIPYATIVSNAPGFVATGELILELAKASDWPRSVDANSCIAQSILADSLGLVSEGTTSETYRRMADLIDEGVDRAALEEARRTLSKMPQSVFRYKAKLIERTEFYFDDRIAILTVPEDELFTVGTLYNPKPLILNELSMVQGVDIAILLKVYKKRLTGAIRSMNRQVSAGALAEQFGGGGHPYSAGFKIEGDINMARVKTEVIQAAMKLLQ